MLERQSDPRKVKASLMWPMFAVYLSPEFHFVRPHVLLDKEIQAEFQIP